MYCVKNGAVLLISWYLHLCIRCFYRCTETQITRILFVFRLRATPWLRISKELIKHFTTSYTEGAKRGKWVTKFTATSMVTGTCKLLSSCSMHAVGMVICGFFSPSFLHGGDLLLIPSRTRRIASSMLNGLGKSRLELGLSVRIFWELLVLIRVYTGTLCCWYKHVWRTGLRRQDKGHCVR